MEQTIQTPDPTTRLALEKLADIVTPSPVSWMPQTWGWAAVALALLAAAMVVIAHWRKRWVANRYRREALESLMRLENDLGNEAMRPSALLAIPELLKRVALAAWPRETVASLSGASWLTFLRTHGGEKSFPDPISRILDDLEYRSTQAIANISEGDARRFAQSARQWIEDHVVSA